jgi:hypothetical protein
LDQGAFEYRRCARAAAPRGGERWARRGALLQQGDDEEQQGDEEQQQGDDEERRRDAPALGCLAMGGA